MKFSRLLAQGLMALGMAGAVVLLGSIPPAVASAKMQGTVRRLSGGPLAHVTHVVDMWERAYQRKDKHAMIFTLMAPTADADLQEKRWQWYRGYGPKDDPGTVHPPILFETSKGSFVPTQYALGKTTQISPGLWDCVVQETGTYKDEDGRYRVVRTRHIIVEKIGLKWYVKDYYLASNKEDYGFYVDDIADQMTKIGK